MIWRRRRDPKDFAEEIRAHLQLEADDLEASGVNTREAERLARVAFGNTVAAQERFNLRGRAMWLEHLLQDVRFGLRMMMRNRAFTAVTVLTLAIGIGASTTAFTWINAVLLQPLGGVADPNRLVTVETVMSNGSWVPNSYPDYQDFRDHLKLFDGIAVTHIAAFSVGKEDHAERVWGEMVSGNFFSVLGVRPEIGRLFLPAEFSDTPGKFPIAVMSDRYWRSHYGADPSVVGRTIRINQHELTIVGVVEPAFHGSIPVTAFDLWIPYMQQPVLNGVKEWMLRDRHNRNMLGIARLKPGVTFDQARQELKVLADRMAVANADVSEGMSATLLPLWKSPHGPQGLLVGPLRILMGVCVLVLLIVCANVANLLLARATVREKEFSARIALGAGRVRLARQVLTECLLLTGSGAVLGLALTPWLSHALKYLMPPGNLQLLVSMDQRPNFAVLAFTAGVCVLAALAAGIAPALQVGQLQLNSQLNANGRNGGAGRSRNRLRSALVASEVALALVALVGAGLFARGFQQTLRIEPGFDPNHVLLSQFYLSTNGYSLAQRKEFCRRLAERMGSTPGVTDVAYSDGVPLGFEPSWWEELRIDGYAPRPNENMNIFRNVVSPGYLPLMHIPILEGRNFTDEDNENSTEPVMIVNQSFARHFFADRDPIGHKIHGWGDWFRVVGVVADSKYHYLGEPATPYFYVPFRQIYREDMNLAFYIRSAGDPDDMLSTLRTQARAIDPNVTVFDAAPLKEFIGASLYPQKVAASLMTVLGVVALLLATIGLYSVMAYSVVQRTHEIGVRMALGAQPASVLRMVIGHGLALTAMGLAAGAALALALARTLAGVSFTNSGMGTHASLMGGSAKDPLVYAAAALFLCVVSAVAAWLPARRAASIDPMKALRTE
ncbi:ABC transporter permease [Acidicapsa ligni]|uniref:ABC transporter permease n=1 Tax=Acidicapsa ligni TaxID=542300 RepID=UPI0021DFACCA|nr:ABC transporter permease [Acidicapsa ligni]